MQDEISDVLLAVVNVIVAMGVRNVCMIEQEFGLVNGAGRDALVARLLKHGGGE